MAELVKMRVSNDALHPVVDVSQATHATCSDGYNVPSLIAYPSPAARSIRPLFLERPPEIRNLIYKALFKVHEPKVLLVYRTEPLRLPVDGIGLLSTSRQVHEEAAGILYGASKFIAPFAVSYLRMEQPISHWLSSIGDKRGLLTGLQIDLTDSLSKLGKSPRVQVTALVRFLFGTGKSHQVPVAFSLNHDRLVRRYARTVEIGSLNGLLSQLKEHAQLKTLLRCWRRMQSVRLSLDGTSVGLVVGSNNGTCGTKLDFYSSDDEIPLARYA